MLRTPEQVREDFQKTGISIAQWATANNFSYPMVLEVLAGRKKGVRGQSHKIAVKLGLKEGTVVDPAKIANCLSNAAA